MVAQTAAGRSGIVFGLTPARSSTDIAFFGLPIKLCKCFLFYAFLIYLYLFIYLFLVLPICFFFLLLGSPFMDWIPLFFFSFFHSHTKIKKFTIVYCGKLLILNKCVTVSLTGKVSNDYIRDLEFKNSLKKKKLNNKVVLLMVLYNNNNLSTQ